MLSDKAKMENKNNRSFEELLNNLESMKGKTTQANRILKHIKTV